MDMNFSIWNQKGFVLRKMTWGILQRQVSLDCFWLITGLVNVENDDTVFPCCILLKGTHIQYFWLWQRLSMFSLSARYNISEGFHAPIYKPAFWGVRIMSRWFRKTKTFFLHSFISMFMGLSYLFCVDKHGHTSLNDGIYAEKYILRWFNLCGNITECSYTNLDGVGQSLTEASCIGSMTVLLP